MKDPTPPNRDAEQEQPYALGGEPGGIVELVARIQGDGRWLRQLLRTLGLCLIAPESERSRAVSTVALPDDSYDSSQLGRSLEARGFLNFYARSYLRRNNWLQICLMGEVRRDDLEQLIPVLAGNLPSRA